MTSRGFQLLLIHSVNARVKRLALLPNVLLSSELNIGKVLG
jgi:hypothetical protein